MNKNLLVPLSIIVAGVIIGGVLLFGGNNQDTSLGANIAQANLRRVDLEIKNMFCVGCRASVVNSVMVLPGVVQADADTRTGSGWVVYDTDKTTKEEIVAASIFGAYPARILADQAYGAPVEQGTTQEIPAEVERKLNDLAQRLQKRGVAALDQFNQKELDDAINRGYWDKVHNLLDNLLFAYE